MPYIIARWAPRSGMVGTFRPCFRVHLSVFFIFLNVIMHLSTICHQWSTIKTFNAALKLLISGIPHSIRHLTSFYYVFDMTIYGKFNSVTIKIPIRISILFKLFDMAWYLLYVWSILQIAGDHPGRAFPQTWRRHATRPNLGVRRRTKKGFLPGCAALMRPE